MTHASPATGSRTLWLEDIKPGMRLDLPDIDCTAALVAGYAELLDAKHPIHVDAEFAKTTRFGRLLAHGPLIIAKSLGMLGEIFHESLVVMLDVGEWRFYGPIFVDTRVRIECFVVDINAPKGGSSGAVRLEIRIMAENGDLAQRGTASVLIQRAPKESS